MKKKLLAVVLTIAIVLSSAAPVFAAGAPPLVPPVPTRVQLCGYTPY